MTEEKAMAIRDALRKFVPSTKEKAKAMADHALAVIEYLAEELLRERGLRTKAELQEATVYQRTIDTMTAVAEMTNKEWLERINEVETSDAAC